MVKILHKLSEKSRNFLEAWPKLFMLFLLRGDWFSKWRVLNELEIIFRILKAKHLKSIDNNYMQSDDMKFVLEWMTFAICEFQATCYSSLFANIPFEGHPINWKICKAISIFNLNEKGSLNPFKSHKLQNDPKWNSPTAPMATIEQIWFQTHLLELIRKPSPN